MRLVPALVIVSLALPVSAQPRVFRDGANHHLGDDSFRAREGRAPTPLDGEAARMRTHLEYVHDLLAARPATRPELAARRDVLLGYLADYIAKGTTPKNTYVAWRNPVFVDEHGAICAVGYLIERDVGRAFAEQIAAEHRLDYLEDIAAAMPAVAAWIDGSGFTLDELASIQPGYEGPAVQHVDGWDEKQIVDGPYTVTGDDGITIAGAFAKHQMIGEWTRKNGDGRVLGRGKFVRGAGTWTSWRSDGTKLAEGKFADSRASGTWRFYYPDGKLAATGAMRHGKRAGTWTFYYDDANARVLARGPFSDGEVVGDWRHFDEHGKLVATASGRAWATLTLDIEPGADGVRHLINQGIPASSERLDGFFVGKDRFYLENGVTLYDEHGYQLDKLDGEWQALDCKWSARKRAAARAGDIEKLHKLLMQHDDEQRDQCTSELRKLSAGEVARLDKMIASRTRVHAPVPNVERAFVEPAREVGRAYDQPDPDDAVAGADRADDMATYLTDHMTWYMEWPYVDQPFVAVYRSLPGYSLYSS